MSRRDGQQNTMTLENHVSEIPGAHGPSSLKCSLLDAEIAALTDDDYVTAESRLLPTTRIRVLVADDDDLLCWLLRDWMQREPDMEMIDAAVNVQEALDKALALRPDVLVLVLKMIGMSDFEVLEHLPPGGPHVLILSAEATEATVLASFRRGAHGFLTKRNAKHHLMDAIRAVASGETWIDTRLTTCLVAELSRLARRVADLDRADAVLSEREREVLCSLGRGLTNTRIASELFVSTNTIKAHVSHILQKLNLPNRTEAALFAVQAGLVKPDELSKQQAIKR